MTRGLPLADARNEFNALVDQEVGEGPDPS